MESEGWFRIAVLVVMVSTLAATAFFRMQASRTKEPISRKEEGVVFATTLRLAGGCLLGLTTTYLLAPDWVQWGAISLPDPVRWLGLGLGGIGALMMAWTLHSLGRNLTDTVITRASAYLVTHGPYRWVRHPFYGCAALVMAGVTLLAANGAIGLCSILVIAMLVVRTPKEERHLIDRFGDAYREYQKRTGAFLPRLR